MGKELAELVDYDFKSQLLDIKYTDIVNPS